MKTVTGLALALSALLLPSQGSATTSGSLTLTTYNIHSGIPDGLSSANHQPSIIDLKNISDVLTTAAADIIALQEVRNLWGLNAGGTIQTCPLNMPLYLASLMSMNYSFGSTLDSDSGYPENRGYAEWGNTARWKNNGASHGEFGNAVLTRLDILPPTIVKLPRGDAKARENMDEARNAVRVQLAEQIPALGIVVIYSTHLQHNNGKTRQAQMTELLRHAKMDATTATVFILGDMNHHPHPGEPDLLGMVKEAGFHDLAAEFAGQSGDEPKPTMNHGNSKRRIDYIFCSRKVSITDVTVLDTPVSDHLPLTVTITLK